MVIAGIIIGVMMIVGFICFIIELRNPHELNPEDENF